MKQAPTKRPIVLSILCGLGFIGCFFKMILVISPVVQAHGRTYAIYLCFSTVVLIAALVGLWMMKRWAFWTFLACALIDQAVYVAMGTWNPMACLLSGMILVAGAVHYRRMS